MTYMYGSYSERVLLSNVWQLRVRGKGSFPLNFFKERDRERGRTSIQTSYKCLNLPPSWMVVVNSYAGYCCKSFQNCFGTSLCRTQDTVGPWKLSCGVKAWLSQPCAPHYTGIQHRAHTNVSVHAWLRVVSPVLVCVQDWQPHSQAVPTSNICSLAVCKY